MEEIFDDVPRKKDPLGLKVQVIRLREQGNSWRECENILNIPQTTLRRVCQDVPNNAQSVPDLKVSVPSSVPQAPQGVPLTNLEIESILKEFETNLLEKVQNAVEERINKALNYKIDNVLNELIDSKIIAFYKGKEVIERG